ncbi:hypothetical protein CGRA01v4_14622 [Colletotrichum graminicola]|uniref:WD domain-containing protein n=1 Tax=Colletotrichum graminicola (strain M1.001 / M2 / FGSC 10212) TaxID=645133 RepID=E3Q4Y1_COLGM|nr:uncharacterized protein GLRG_01290 [Colletotrichum graminicola M1.001]EFQ26146.1 hypothetical protein GLRG_01290 [Colletotrichum graminicola M1.001]WDK23331.1 hypothetical protein CGRA01v4_14622 [Colletotrichum graminicola]
MPQTPGHSRNPSSVDASYQYNSVSSSPRRRRTSRSSANDPATPLRSSFNTQYPLDISYASGGMNDGNGLGNLADELADAFSDSGDEDEYYEDDNDHETGNGDSNGKGTPNINIQETERRASAAEGIRDSGVDVACLGDDNSKAKNLSLGPPPLVQRGHRRSGSEYDGSEYGSESDLDSPGMLPSLVAKMDAVESLARRGTESNGGPTDGVFRRVTEGLRDLGSQAGVEGSATRLITAHSALTTHLTHQTRQLHNLTFPLLSPLVPPPDSETIDELLPLLIELSESMPRPTTKAYDSLTALHTLTSDLVQSLNYLSDTLHMSRQTTTTATRRLKSAKELVAEIKREEELREEGERWLNRGNWSERLAKRECAGVCGDVVGGFEEVCNGWRARLLEQASSAQA